MPVITRPDPFSAQLLNSPPLVVTLEQQNYIREILETACSDSRFADKAYVAIWKVLTAGNTVPPVITSLNPSTAKIGDPGFMLHVNGTGFKPQSEIIWNGSPESTVYVNDTELTTLVDMSTATVAVDLPVAVETDGVRSDALTFSLTPSEPIALSTKQSEKKPDLIPQPEVKKVK